MQGLLSGAEFDHQGIEPAQARALSLRGEQLLQRALSTEEWCTAS
jgi:hypothetical protein